MYEVPIGGVSDPSQIYASDSILAFSDIHHERSKLFIFLHVL